MKSETCGVGGGLEPLRPCEHQPLKVISAPDQGGTGFAFSHVGPTWADTTATPSPMFLSRVGPRLRRGRPGALQETPG
jgi:hypothetical protein